MIHYHTAAEMLNNDPLMIPLIMLFIQAVYGIWEHRQIVIQEFRSLI